MKQTLRMSLMVFSAALTTGALAHSDVQEVVLKDGTMVLIFEDGKMSMRDAQGRSFSMKDGVRMEARDGRIITMKGNEVWRLTRREQEHQQMYQGQ